MYLLLLLLIPCFSLYLNNDQYYTIIKLIRNKQLLPKQRVLINNILYKSHEKYALKKSLLFKRRHYYKCKRISNDEINQYARFGLYKALQNYNGKTNFTYYADLYINYELNNGLSDAFSLSILPRNIRKQSKKNYTTEEINSYNNLFEVDMRSNINHWNNKIDNSKSIISKMDSIEKYKIIWDNINNLDPDIKYIMHLKYEYEFNEIRTNKDISRLLCCSYETIRKKINKFKVQLKDFL